MTQEQIEGNKTYLVILHSPSPSGLALKQQPEMKEPDQLNYLGFNGRTLFKRKIKEYRQHLSDIENNIIDIAPEYQEYWELSSEVSELDFINLKGVAVPNWQQYLAPAKEPQEKEQIHNAKLQQTINEQISLIAQLESNICNCEGREELNEIEIARLEGEERITESQLIIANEEIERLKGLIEKMFFTDMNPKYREFHFNAWQQFAKENNLS